MGKNEKMLKIWLKIFCQVCLFFSVGALIHNVSFLSSIFHKQDFNVDIANIEFV